MVPPGDTMKGRAAVLIAGMILGGVLCSRAVDNSWLERVPESDRSRSNPYAGQADAVAAGSKLFADHCSKCHGGDALGRGKRPSLRSKEVQQATDGQIFWFLRNGNLRRGMPSWSSLPEPSRWQIIAYLKSLGEQPGTGENNPPKGNE
jgi:mono/diheme cytochrome c family protein